MTLLLTFLLLLAPALTPSVALTVTKQAGPKNLHLHYVVAGPYEGRVCLDVDTPEGEHVAAVCVDATVTVAAGATIDVNEDVHGPEGRWLVAPVLPDTPGDDDVIKGVPQTLVIEKELSA